MKKIFISRIFVFLLGATFCFGVTIATQVVRASTVFSLFDCGEQQDGDINTKIRQQIDSGHTTITLYNARKETIDEEDVYKATVIAVESSVTQ